jgi:hypothetical protein
MVAATYICWYFVKEEMTATVNTLFYAIMLVVSLVLDIVWLSYNTKELWGTDYIDGRSLNGLRICTIVMSFVILIPKVSPNSSQAIAIFLAYSLGINQPLLAH